MFEGRFVDEITSVFEIVTTRIRCKSHLSPDIYAIPFLYLVLYRRDYKRHDDFKLKELASRNVVEPQNAIFTIERPDISIILFRVETFTLAVRSLFL